MKLSEEEKKAHKRAIMKKYRQTPKGKAVLKAAGKRYRQSLIGITVRKKYQQSPERKAYERSPKRKNALKKYDQSPRGRLSRRYAAMRFRAKSKKMLLLTKEEFAGWWESRPRTTDGLLICEICDGPATENTAKSDPTHFNIDRKDNNIGYIVSNMAITCRRCNYKVKRDVLSFEAARFAVRLDKIKDQKKREEIVDKALADLADKEEVSMVITQVKDKPAKITYFTVDGTTVPSNQVTKSGTRFFRAPS